jgi:DNA invertase Pin-like site-specific DNA recombinase
MRERLAAYAREKLPGVEWKGAFGDVASARGRRFAQRPAGERVLFELERGDHLVIAEAAPAFKDWADCLHTLRYCQGSGIEVHFLDPPADTVTPGGRAALDMLRRFAEAERGRRAERAREGNVKRRKRGKPTNQNAPYGFRYVGPRGNKRKVAVEYTRTIGRYIVQWRLAGHSWEAIYFNLLRQHVRTRDGREWSYGAIQRAFRGECRLQAEEGRQLATR